MPKTICDIKLYTLLELSNILGITSITLRKYIKSGKLKARKIGGAFHISEENLKEFVSGTEVEK